MTDWAFIAAMLEIPGTFSSPFILWLYLFSGVMREVTEDASANTRKWVRGRWSVRTGRDIPTVKPLRD